MQLADKTILFLGSSVTYGAASNGISFAELMAEECRFTCLKEAVSGTTLADIDEKSYVARLKKLPTETKIDLFVCQLSTNDVWRSPSLSETESAIRFIVGYVKDTFRCPVVFYTSPYFDCPPYEDMIALLLRLAKELDFAVLDLFHDAEMCAVTPEDRARYMADAAHPTLLGYREWWMPKFIAFLQSL